MEIDAATKKGPHLLVWDPEAMEVLAKEVTEKVAVGQARVVKWDTIKDSPPPSLKISPIAMIPHKSRKFRVILDLLFIIRLEDGSTVPLVNKTLEKTAPRGAIDQMGHVLTWIIHAFAQANRDALILQAKWDINDGF